MQKALQAKRIAQLTEHGERLFHAKDLKVWWNIQNPNSLRMTLKRYVDAGLIHRVYRGFYSLLPLEKLNPIELGQKALHGYAYLSTESILFERGIISQPPSAWTFVSVSNKKLACNKERLLSRKLSKKYPMNPAGITFKDGMRTATPERAIADLLYFNPMAHFDRPIDWESVKSIQESVGYPLTPKRYALA